MLAEVMRYLMWRRRVRAANAWRDAERTAWRNAERAQAAEHSAACRRILEQARRVR